MSTFASSKSRSWIILNERVSVISDWVRIAFPVKLAISNAPAGTEVPIATFATAPPDTSGFKNTFWLPLVGIDNVVPSKKIRSPLTI
ncbi:hypothetical protein D3C72_2168070 [compost metagenome]